MTLDRPIHAAETADETAAPAVAAPLASGFAAYDGLAQMPPDFRPSQAGWRVMITSRAALAPSLRIIPRAVQAQSDPTGVTAGVKHVYRVKAINAAGLSGWSNYVNPTP